LNKGRGQQALREIPRRFLDRRLPSPPGVFFDAATSVVTPITLKTLRFKRPAWQEVSDSFFSMLILSPAGVSINIQKYLF